MCMVSCIERNSYYELRLPYGSKGKMADTIAITTNNLSITERSAFKVYQRTGRCAYAAQMKIGTDVDVWM